MDKMISLHCLGTLQRKVNLKIVVCSCDQQQSVINKINKDVKSKE